MRGRQGVYAFFYEDKAVYVGRTRNLLNRLRGHVRPNHNSATFAFKQTRLKLKRVATYKREGGRAELVKDAQFGPEFNRQIELVKEMDVHFVEVKNPITQYLLELYAHLEWGLPLDEFDTH